MVARLWHVQHQKLQTQGAQRRTPSTKDTLFVTFHMNSQPQIIVTTNKNNLQGDQTSDIHKDTADIKERPCWMWLLGGVVATIRPLSPGKAEASVEGSWNLHHKAGHLGPEHKLPLPPPARQDVCNANVTSSSCPWGFVFTPSPGLWALGRGCTRGSAHLLTDEGKLRTKATRATCPHSSPVQLPSAAVPSAPGHDFSPCLSHLLAFQKLYNVPRDGHC